MALYYCVGVTGFVPLRRLHNHSHYWLRREQSDPRTPQDHSPLAIVKLETRIKGRMKQNDEMSMNTSALLNSVLRRAERTLHDRDEEIFSDQEEVLPFASQYLGTPVPVRDLLGGLQKETKNSKSSTMTSRTPSLLSSPDNTYADESDNCGDGDDDLLNYGSNPSITMTALAHTLWKSIIRPGRDSAIDATAGNGGDAAALAKLLFAEGNSNKRNSSHLVCIDIQQTACEATQKKLSKIITDSALCNQVTVYHGSHAPLTLPPDASGPVAVVAFNLGYLPGQERSTDATITQTSTTLSALTDAVLCLRLGGLLSVLTYPQTNSVEDAAAQAFVEGLALFSSQSHDWRDFLLDHDPTRYAALGDTEIRCGIRQRLQHIHEELGARQCWRVHVHEKLGWVNAPRLLTAIRIR